MIQINEILTDFIPLKQLKLISQKWFEQIFVDRSKVDSKMTIIDQIMSRGPSSIMFSEEGFDTAIL